MWVSYDFDRHTECQTKKHTLLHTDKFTYHWHFCVCSRMVVCVIQFSPLVLIVTSLLDNLSWPISCSCFIFRTFPRSFGWQSFPSSLPSAVTAPSHPPTPATTPLNTRAWWRRCSAVSRYSTTRVTQSSPLALVLVCTCTQPRFSAWLHYLVRILCRCHRCPGRTRGTRIVLVGAQRTWITWLYPPAPFTPGTCVHDTQQDVVMNEHVKRGNLSILIIILNTAVRHMVFHIILMISLYRINVTNEVSEKQTLQLTILHFKQIVFYVYVLL